MKKQLVSTVLFALLVTLPSYADNTSRHTAKSDKRDLTAKAPLVQSHSYATPEPTVSWHDLHWFE